IPTFTTLIGLVRHGEPLIGLIANPSTKEYWLGVKGGKLVYSGRAAMHVEAPTPSVAQAMLGTTDPLLMPPSFYKRYQQLRNACAFRSEERRVGKARCVSWSVNKRTN